APKWRRASSFPRGAGSASASSPRGCVGTFFAALPGQTIIAAKGWRLARGCRAREPVRTSGGAVIDVMEASKDRYCDDLCSLGVAMWRKGHRRAERTLSD